MNRIKILCVISFYILTAMTCNQGSIPIPLQQEALMSAEFVGEWEAYCKQTRRLIPYIF